MTSKTSTTGAVLQGYFAVERFRGSAGQAPTAQPKAPPRPGAQSPRPDLLPARMRSGAAQAQAKVPRGPTEAWSAAPRPDLLPGMGPAKGRAPRPVGQAKSSGVTTTPIAAGLLRVIGGGLPLEPGIRQTMEQFFGADFSGVRVHEGPTARAMGALAFTLGEELHFAPGLYDPHSRAGVELLGHELTHVVQQREGRVTNPYGQGVAIVQDPALEAEADQMGRTIADAVASGSRVGQRRSLSRRTATRTALQLSEAEWQSTTKKAAPKLSRDEAWDDDDIVMAAQEAVNEWCQRKSKGKKQGSKHTGGDLITCLWVYVTNSGRVMTAEATNENPHKEYRSLTKGKPTVCAEDMMCHLYPELKSRTLYSIAFNETQGMTWPACSTVNGGCRGLLAGLGIVEPPYAGLERDLGGKRIYDH